jgi:hypothetical protein
MSDVIKNIIIFINGNKVIKILICILLAVWACSIAYELGNGIGEAIYYITHPQ